jgi:hypothetical protein
MQANGDRRIAPPKNVPVTKRIDYAQGTMLEMLDQSIKQSA